MANSTSKNYGDTVTFGGTEFTTSGLVNGDTVTSVTLTSAGAAATATVGGSPYSIVPSAAVGSGLGNYNLKYANGTLTVNPAPLSITPDGGKSKYYGDVFSAFTGVVSGLKNSDAVTVSYASTGAAATAGVGNYDITVQSYTFTVGSAGNYNITTNTVTGGLKVNPAPLTIAANNKTMILNGSLPVFDATYSGFVLGQGPGNLSGTLSCTTTTNGTVVGSFPINCLGQTSTNYAIAYKPGTLSVNYQTGGMCAGDVGHAIRQPINTDGSSVFKLGSTVPTKFAVCDATGNSIGTSGVIKSYYLVAAGQSTGLSVDESIYSNTPDTAFRWDSTAQQWIFNQGTGKSTNLSQTNTIYVFNINLNDGTLLQFQYGLK